MKHEKRKNANLNEERVEVVLIRVTLNANDILAFEEHTCGDGERERREVCSKRKRVLRCAHGKARRAEQLSRYFNTVEE